MLNNLHVVVAAIPIPGYSIANRDNNIGWTPTEVRTIHRYRNKSVCYEQK